MKTKQLSKIQCLLITHLLNEGSIELILPDGMVLEVGITQENGYGDLEKTPDYCWVIASQHDRSVSIDSYNLGLRVSRDSDKLICEQEATDHNGQPIMLFNVA